MGLFDRIRDSWNAFVKVGEPDWSAALPAGGGGVSWGSTPPQRTVRHIYSERSVVSSIYTRLAMDVAGCTIKHVQVDAEDRYTGDVDSSLNDCLTMEANLDQAPRQFRQDLAMTVFDQGVAAIVPVDTSRNPETDAIFDVFSLRVGEITQWYPKHIRVRVWNQDKGVREEILLEKRICAIVENPLYSTMNEPNSTLQRLIKKLGLLDSMDDQTASGKLDIIIQLPYVIKTEQKKLIAEQRREDLETQLKGSKYGVAYADATEKITQLNRPAENNLLKQVEYLTNLLYVQLGLTPEVMNGTADEAAMINYYTRTVEPVMDAFVEAMQRAFLGPRGTSQGERIRYFKDPFKFVPVSQIADIADKFIRNQIAAPNEIRQAIGMVPSTDPKADELSNPNMPKAELEPVPKRPELPPGSNNTTEGNRQNGG